ncbi:S-adenosyl methyltransferase [Saccharopolyspora antimicrobica]|uniref:S-adenosyl methyltransferase n=1 Tax=Saccharopolyspora antimicrobica TaxID=455193 RepID=A0A1I5HHW1_9PSEU|nr:SAM-dependent methyltransferase [Saccharopolyspora antimicrobica]RKT85285.1 S-adenosyl methyltransferase [Saccharopolyspora antimicrobica]SFO47872.1 S-adenosyl methyltransferase [Saccharopolyspora antimicrobica]
MTRTGEAIPGGINPERPSIARVYDAVLGGKDNYASDRAVAGELLSVAPGLGELARDNRAFLVRATRYLAGTVGIDQFLDCGGGLPTADNLHQVAQRANPHATVVYVDNDPMVVAHGRALLTENEDVRYVAGDLADPEALLADPVIARGLDWSRPIALLQLCTLHHLPDEVRVAELMARYFDALPSGSYLVLSHLFRPGAEDPEAAELAERLEPVFLRSALGSGRFRTREEIAACFAGAELLDPGLVTLSDWWPDGPRAERPAPARRLLLGGIARKP